MNSSMEPLVDYHPASVVAVQDDLVTIQMAETKPRPLFKNEVIYICLRPHGDERQEKLKAEVLRVRGRLADAQVFESTKGVAIGDPVEQTGEQLSVTLGPGLLGLVYDGLQNPLAQIAAGYGTFLPRGADVSPLDREKKWSFQPRAKIGDTLHAGDVIGTVQEGRFSHKIMIPFDQHGAVTLDWIQQGSFTIDTAVARIRDGSGTVRPLTLTQQWPVRRPLPQALLETNRCERLYPQEPMITTQRIIDTFLPIARGGTGCIPGPFGAGKTVLQNLISRHSDVDIVLVVACGERAGEVVETITEFPKLSDPKTGGSLMDRTIIICNTSSMPVAAR
jgi:V/A-type H+/Na+-transporting ATPase subunit A